MSKFLDQTSPDHTAFYVSAIDGARKFVLAGPYRSHEVAKAQIAAVRDLAERGNPRAVFMAFGTCGHGAGVEAIKTPLGAEWTPTRAAA